MYKRTVTLRMKSRFQMGNKQDVIISYNTIKELWNK